MSKTVTFDRLGWGLVGRVFGAVAVILLTFAVMGAATGTAAAQSAPDCSTVTYNGDGSSVNPFEISNVDQLQCIEDQGLSFEYRVVSDIDASETAVWNGGDGFNPIGERHFTGTPFNGTLDGAGHEITGLSIGRGSEDSVGLFASIGPPGTVTNVSLNNIAVAGEAAVGGLVGDNEGNVNRVSASGDIASSGSVLAGGLVGDNEGTVRESSASGNVEADGSSVGGLVGGNKGTVRESSASSNVVAGENVVGGLVGKNDDDATVRESSAYGNVSGGNFVGGLVGSNDDDATVRESSAYGNVSGGNFVGGLVGLVGSNDDDATVRESSAYGNVSGNTSVGGLVGQNEATVEDSYARGAVSGFVTDVGGLVGRNGESGDPGTVRRSYATGVVTGPLFFPDPIPDPGPIPDPTLTQDTSGTTGGLVGNNSVGTVTDSYWDVNTTGRSSSDGGTGLTTEEMTGDAATGNMTGFDFTSTWKTVSGDYPILAFQSQDSGGGGNPFFDASGNPVSRRTVINRVVEWNMNGSIDGTPFTRREIINFVVQWNLA